MAMYYYATKLSAIACGTRCRQAVMQKNRGQRDRDKDRGRMQSYPGDDSDDNERHLQVCFDFF